MGRDYDVYETTVLGEPKLDKYDLYPTISAKNRDKQLRKDMDLLMNILTYLDGETDLIGIADVLNVWVGDVMIAVNKLFDAGLLRRKDAS